MQLLATHAGKRVLVAEDEPVNSEIAAYLLEEAGFVVDLAEDGVQALEMAAAQAYDLVIMDMQMPRMSGLDATRALRQMPQYAHVPIVAMTANAFVEDRVRCLEAGMNGFVTKPMPARVLYAALLQVLNSAAA
jgi:hypothetical protein